MKRYLKPVAIFILSLVPWILITKILYLKDPVVWPDEAIYVETANNILRTGRLATSLFGSAIPGLSTHALWYPPLYFYILAAWMAAFGQSIEVVRFLSVILAFLSLVIFFCLLQRKFSKLWISFLGVLLLSNDMYFSASSRTGRMDMVNFFFLMAGLFLCIEAIQRRQNWILVLAGVSCGLAVLTHPYGLIVPAVLLIYIFLSRFSLKEKMRMSVYIITPVILAGLIWLFLIGGDFGLFMIQYRLQFMRKFSEQLVLTAMIEYNNYLWVAVYFCYFIFTISLFVQIIKKRKSWDLFLFLGTLIAVTVSSWGKEFWFIIYFQPFLILIALSILYGLFKMEKKLFLALSGVLFFIILSLSLYYYVGYIWESGWNNPGYHNFTRVIRHLLPKKATIYLASLPDPYFDLKKNPNLSFYEFPTVPISRAASRKLLDDSDYIIYNLEGSEDVNKIIKEYIDENAKHIITIRSRDGYTVDVIQFVSKDERE